MKFLLSREQIVELYEARSASGCLASNRITVNGMKVGYMYREEPDFDSSFPDSGWRFFAGDEDEAYTECPGNFNIFDLNTICNYDPDIIPCLNAPYGAAFIRQGDVLVKDNFS